MVTSAKSEQSKEACRTSYSVSFKKKLMEFAFDRTTQKSRFAKVRDAIIRQFNVDIDRRRLNEWSKTYFKGGYDGAQNDTQVHCSTPMYVDVELKLIQYIKLRTERYQRDKCGLFQSILQMKALEFA